jgi:ABC-type bacteriocin/lantibiotic exporter with double-glycine peptidase domain
LLDETRLLNLEEAIAMFKKEEVYKIATLLTYQAYPMISGDFDLEKIREKIYSDNLEIDLNSTEQAIYDGALSVEKGEKYQINGESASPNRFAVWCAIDMLFHTV